VRRDNAGRVVRHLAIREDVGMSEEHEKKFGFEMVHSDLDVEIEEALRAECGPAGHKAVVRSCQKVSRILECLHEEVKCIPGETVALLRAEVISLIDAHAGDAVKRQIDRMLPADALGGPVAPSDGKPRVPAGVWSVVATMSRTAPWAMAATTMFACVGWVGWLLAKGRGWL